MKHIDRLKEIWEAVYFSQKETSVVIETYFYKDYKQCINGVILSRDEYIPHVIAQKNSIILSNIEYLHHIEKEDTLFAIYFPKGKNRDGEIIEAEVISYFQFYQEKIRNIYGQVRLIKGKFSDVDMHTQDALI